MLTVEGSVNVPAVEKYLENLADLKSSATLRVPTHLQEERAGGAAALIQFLFTWQTRIAETALVTHIGERSQATAQLKNLAEEYHGFCALLLSDHVFSAKSESLDEEAFIATRRRYAEIGSRVYHRGTRASVIISEHSGPTAPSSPFEGLAIQENKAERRTAFIRAIHEANARCLAPSSAKPLVDEYRSDLANIVYELFANAEEWGGRELDGTPIAKAIRGISIAVYGKEQLSGKSLASHAKTFPALAQYFANHERDKEGLLRPFLEISVFDNGIGLARQHLKRQDLNGIPIEAEYLALQECLRHHVSSARSVSRGVGLYLIMKLLHRVGGFLRIRTGRLSLYRDFVEDSYLFADIEAGMTGPLMKHMEALRDFRTGENAVPTCCEEATGALFTVWIPLRNLDTQPALF